MICYLAGQWNGECSTIHIFNWAKKIASCMLKLLSFWCQIFHLGCFDWTFDSWAPVHEYWVSNARFKTKTDVYLWQGLRSSVFRSESCKYFILNYLSIRQDIWCEAFKCTTENQFVSNSCFKVSRFVLMQLINAPVDGSGEKWCSKSVTTFT